MPESSAKRSTIVEQLLKRPLPQHESETEDAIESFQEGRSRSRQYLRLVNGAIESFAYAYLTRVLFTPGDTLDLRFGTGEVRIKGRNLSRLRETITEQRTRFIQEGTEGEDGLKPADAAHVEAIVIIEGEEL